MGFGCGSGAGGTSLCLRRTKIGDPALDLAAGARASPRLTGVRLARQRPNKQLFHRELRCNDPSVEPVWPYVTFRCGNVNPQEFFSACCVRKMRNAGYANSPDGRVAGVLPGTRKPRRPFT